MSREVILTDDEIFKSIDGDMIEKSLKDSFIQNFQPYTTLIGLLRVCENVPIADLCLPGKKCVEVLGGNHTRAALQRILKSDECVQKEKYEFVYMDIYQNLTKDQALFLAFKHNEIHEHSQELSFAEKVSFFRKLLLTCRRNYAGQTPKTISTKWRSEIAAIMNKSKTELKNSYKVHLNLAASEDDIWELIKDVFTAFEHGCIKGQKRSEQCSQYCFWHFSKVKRKDLKILLLTRFKNGDLIPEEFRSACQRCERESTTEVPEEKSPTKRMKTTSQKRKANDEAETESITKCKRSKKKMAEKETQIDSDNKEIKELKQKIVTMSEKLRCTEQSLIEQKHLVKEKDGKIVVLKKQLISVVTKAEEQKVMVANLNKRIIDLEKELEVEIQNRLHAEEAAVRARQNTQITPTSQQKSLEKRKSVPDDLPRVRSAGEKKKNKEIEEEQEKEILLVEYTNGKIFYAARKGAILTYCHKPVGLIRDAQFVHSPQKHSFKLNDKDQQTFQQEFIILSMKGIVDENIIKIDKLSTTVDEQLVAITKYIEEK
uniref:Uncharacterized protein n=1 Tax=Magallana gigas TaxID=29159 RepID=K1QG55_MAGGI